MVPLFIVYGLGVIVGLGVMRDAMGRRLVTALLWPLGPLAGFVVVTGLVCVAVALWPVPLLTGAAVLGGLMYMLS